MGGFGVETKVPLVGGRRAIAMNAFAVKGPPGLVRDPDDPAAQPIMVEGPDLVVVALLCDDGTVQIWREGTGWGSLSIPPVEASFRGDPRGQG